MNKKDFKKLKPGKKIYIVDMEDYCECPFCNGDCIEPMMFDSKVYSVNLKTGNVFAKICEDSFHVPSWNYKDVFTRKKDAEKRLQELMKT